MLLLTIVFPAVGQKVCCKGVAEQTGAVFHLAAFGRLLTKLTAAVDVLGINARFGPVDLRVGVQPVVPFRCNVVANLRIALDGGTVGHRVTAVRPGGLRIFWLLGGVVVVAQGAAQGLGRVDFPAAFRQHVVDGFVVRRGSTVALADVTAIPAGPGDQTVQRIGAAIGAGAHPEATIARRARSKHAVAAVFTRFEQIVGIGGVIRDHAAQRAAAVQQGRRAADHLDTFD